MAASVAAPALAASEPVETACLTEFGSIDSWNGPVTFQGGASDTTVPGQDYGFRPLENDYKDWPAGQASFYAGRNNVAVGSGLDYVYFISIPYQQVAGTTYTFRYWSGATDVDKDDQYVRVFAGGTVRGRFHTGRAPVEGWGDYVRPGQTDGTGVVPVEMSFTYTATETGPTEFKYDFVLPPRTSDTMVSSDLRVVMPIVTCS